MSGAPKRSHEESGHSSSSKYPHEDSGTYPKLPPSVSNEYHQPYEMGQDSRLTKIPRTESRDADRRSPLHSIYRMPSASNDLHVDHPPASENRLESRDSKDTRDLRFENRDKKTETREPYSEVRRDTPNAKVEKDVRHDIRGDDNKEVKSERENYNDVKADLKAEGYGVASSHLNYKESKEYHRGKRYSDAPVGSTDTWHRSTSQGHVEVGKEVPTTEERDHVEAHEAVGENRYDSKGDDKFKDKDRKRKDIKHRDWGERDKERSDRRSNVQVANSSSDCKDSAKEERDAERWERERRDTAKDKEILKERERDHTKRDTWSGVEKDSSNTEKEVGDGSIRMPEHETLPPEQKKQKDFESWRTADRESRDRRKERDVDAEGDRPEKRIRSYDKESDDGGADGEAATDKEREVYNYGVQQRKRMQRSRAAPANRELRFRSHTQDNEGSQGKAEVSSVVYKVGECMQELIKLWKEHEASPGEKNGETSVTGPTLEIRIPSDHVTATNRQVRGGQLWGTDIYTDDSDLVAVLMHTGYCRPTASPPPSAIQELRATVRILPPQDCYISTLRNNVRSRAWGAAIGCSYRVERCCIVKKAGGSIDLEPCLTHTSTVEPTLAPVVVERTMTTRAAASNALRQQRFVREVTIQYNLCNEPWIKYSISIVADKGLKKTLYTSARLKKGEVLYLETHSCRYELCFNGEKIIKASQLSQMHEGENEKNQNHASHSTNGERNDSENIIVDVFRWSRCKTPLPQKVMRSVGIPLPLEHVEVLEENLDWEDVQWSQTGVWIAGKEYSLARVRGGQLWGTDIYTDDSDLVGVLMHTGYCRPTASPPPSAIQELRATVRILPPQDCYISTLRNNVRSRAWGAAIGCSYRVERCCIYSEVEPTLAPVVVERTMTTRAAASNALRQQRFVREVTIQYNLCHEPWIKYSISIVADKGLKKTLYTSARLKKGEVLYLETHSCRYELCFNGEKIIKASQLSQMHEGENEKNQNQNHASHSTNGERNDSENIIVDVFRWSRCKLNTSSSEGHAVSWDPFAP